MEFSNVLLSVITCVIIIYFAWNYFNNRNRNRHQNTSQGNDIRYYELKAKYEFLVAVGTLFTAVAVFYGFGTKKDIDQNIKTEFNALFAPTKKRVSVTESKVAEMDQRLKNAQAILNSYYGALKEIDSRQKQINLSSQKSKEVLKRYESTVDSLNKSNVLKRNFYLVDNLTVNYNKIYDTVRQQLAKTYAYDTLLTTLGDRLPQFKKPPIIVGVTDVGFGIHTFDVNTRTFKILLDINYFTPPANNLIKFRLIITPGE